METAGLDAATEAERQVAKIRDDPAARLEFARRIYDHLTASAPSAGNFGRAEHAFMQRAIERGVFAPLDASPPGSAWWRTVNEQLLRDCEEGSILASSSGDRWSNAAVRHWLAFFREPSAAAWYRGHNASIVLGYERAVPFAMNETAAERVLMNLILVRALYAHGLVEDAVPALRHLEHAGSWLADPRRRGIVAVIDVPDFYPRRYPLGDHDQKRIEGAGFTPEELMTRIGNKLMLHHVSDLFEWSATTLGMPQVVDLVAEGRPCYPRI